MSASTVTCPIALFVYNRLEHTKITIDALLKNPEAKDSKLYIFSDAAKDESDAFSVKDVRGYIGSISGFKNVIIIERESNYGLAESIIDGVTFLSDKYGRVIVLEDDIVTSPYFLRYMNQALDLYDNNEKIGSISAYMYPVEVPTSEDTFFSFAPQSWGWATWKKEWELFESDGDFLLNNIYRSGKASLFEENGPHSYLKMLKGQIEGKNNSWFIRWYASCFLHNKLTLMPTKSLVQNIGIDGTGTHCADWKFDPYMVDVSSEPLNVKPIAEVVHADISKALSNCYKKIRRLRWINFFYRVVSKLGIK